MAEVKFNQGSKAKPFLGAFFILLSLIVFVLVSRTFVSQADSAEESLSQKQTEYQELLAKINSFEADKEELDLTSDVQRLNVSKAIPVGLNQDTVIENITNVAEENGIQLNSIGFGRGGVLSEGIGVLRVNASFEGDFDDLISFLEGIEGNERLMKVNSISVQLSAFEVAGIRRTNFSLSIESYYQL
ncbi:type 4a pilus biogenesis protein PilO [Candidatus Peregrinibacteria bacterium]|nr:type 4a pilus biogenesis protein PilO [Candidatus Peregrinibacteria bacterium]